jgi:hypothetical protein
VGDYNVLIVSAKVRTSADEKTFKEEFQEMFPQTDSAYHATAPFIEWNGWTVSAIGQAKYNRGVAEFMDWLRPHVIAGMGPRDAWAINFSEYTDQPTIEYLREPTSDEGYT